MTSAQKLINELMGAFHINEPDPDIINDGFLPSLDSNPYSLQCLIDWIYNIEENDKLIELDFDKIEQDLEQLSIKYGSKVQGLFYPNWKPMKYIYPYQSYRHKHYHESIYEKNKENIKHIHKQIFGGTESIIHYILHNKTFIFKLPSPDVDNLQPKLDNIIKKNGNELFKSNMKQSIYILRLLLFKYEIISVDLLYEDHCTMWYDVESTMRGLIATKDFNDQEIKSLYLDLLCDIYSISESDQGTKGHNAIINVFCEESETDDEDGNSYKYNRWIHRSFFDNPGENYADPVSISLDIMKELLFRGIPPLQIQNRAPIADYEIEKYSKYTLDAQSKFYNQCINDMMTRKDNTKYFSSLSGLRTITLPLIVCNIANSIKKEMNEILNACLDSIMTQDCIQCILDYIYVDWNDLMPEFDENDTLIMTAKFFNYLFNELQGEYMRESIITDIFIKGDNNHGGNNVSAFALNLLYQFVKLEKLPDDMLRIFMEKTTEYGMVREHADISIDIISIHVLNSACLKSESYMKWYRNEIHSYIEQLNWWRHNCNGWNVRQQFIDGVLDNEFPSNFLQILKTEAEQFRESYKRGTGRDIKKL